MPTLIPTLQNALNAEMDKVLGCIHCGLCLPACPTYNQVGNENDSPRGRIYLMRAVAEGKLDAGHEKFARHIDLCLGCRACETACPAGVNYGFLLEAARSEILNQEKGAKAGAQKRMLKLALRKVFPYPERLSRILSLTRWFRDSSLILIPLHFAPVRWLMKRIAPQSEFALSLLLASKPVFRKAAGRKQKAKEEGVDVSVAIDEKQADELRLVSLFTGCVMDGLFRHTNEATARVLAANGCVFHPVKTQVCCGALHAHAGDVETARKLARQNIDAFAAGEEAEIPSTIIINSAGCGSVLKEYGELLKNDSAYARRAHLFSLRVRDISEYLAEIGPRQGAPVSERVTYDAPCHLYHAQRVTSAPQQVLKAAIPDLAYAPLEGMTDCCGGAGTYNLSEPEMSGKILLDKIAKAKATGAKLLLTANPGCHMQLGAGARLFGADCRVAHVIELVDESYRRAGFYESDSAEG
ncbi:MAG TPA: heterodisulfide reductase-related iron-sulfur binding cluster [Blastocatellia bacterium]|nr:heterodisulfide reductase-related iron-sulfur binding cluster [Blastocatellia bacterium]